MENITIRQIAKDNVRAFREMHAKSWLDTYKTDDQTLNSYIDTKTSAWLTDEALQDSEERIQKIIENKADFFRIAVDRKVLVGFVHGRKYEDRQGLEAIYIDKDYQGRGVSGALLASLEDWFDDNLRTETSVTAYNKRAIRFYEKNGFVKVEGSEHLFDDIMPVFDMVRSAKVGAKTVLIIHGIGGRAGIHWQQWLHDQLIKLGYKVIMPNLSDSDNPDRQTWLDELKLATKDVDFENLIIVGHSLGVTAAVDLVQYTNDKILGLVSVSGFYRPYGAELNEQYLQDRQIDISKIHSLVSSAVVIYGDDDPYVPQVELIAVADGLKVAPVIIPEGGHVNTDSGFVELPQALEFIKNIEVNS